MLYVCIDSTVFKNFLPLGYIKELEKFLECLPENCQKVGYKEEIEEILIELGGSFLLITEEDVSWETFESLKNKYPGIDDGETCLLSFALEKKDEGANACFMSDDKKARGAGREEGILFCCVKNLKVGGTLGILSFLVNQQDLSARDALLIHRHMRDNNNHLPEDYNPTKIESC